MLAVRFVNGVPLNSDTSDEVNAFSEIQHKLVENEQTLLKRSLPVEGILIGRRDFPTEGILVGKRDYPMEGILLGKRYFPIEGILVGKRRVPVDGTHLTRRSFRLLAHNPTGYNEFDD